MTYPTLPWRSGSHDFRGGDTVERVSGGPSGVLGKIVTVHSASILSGAFLAVGLGGVVSQPSDAYRLLYDKDGWRPWAGGECPVKDEATWVEIITKAAAEERMIRSERADVMRWYHIGLGGDILAWRPDAARNEVERKRSEERVNPPIQMPPLDLAELHANGIGLCPAPPVDEAADAFRAMLKTNTSISKYANGVDIGFKGDADATAFLVALCAMMIEDEQS